MEVIQGGNDELLPGRLCAYHAILEVKRANYGVGSGFP